MANDGLQQIMAGGVVVSGNETPVTQMGAAEGILAFADWADVLGADGSVPFAELAAAYLRGQGWQIDDIHFRAKLRTPPLVEARRERTENTETTGIRVTAPVAVVIDGEVNE